MATVVPQEQEYGGPEGSQVSVAANQLQQPVPAALPPYYIQPGQQQPVQYVVAAPQPNAVQYPAQPVQYVYMPQQPPVQVVSQGPPSDKRLLPNDNLYLVSVVTVICSFLNITSLIIGLPAVCLAMKARQAKKSGKYMKTKSLGYAAMCLCCGNMLYTSIATIALVSGVLITPLPYLL